MNRIARFILPVAALVAILASALAPLARAQLTDNESGFYYEPLRLRHTSAATVAREPVWGKGGNGPGTLQVLGFADSTVFRQTGTNLANVAVFDTTVAYSMAKFRLPPGFEHRPSSQGMRITKSFGTYSNTYSADSTYADTTDTTPWVAIRVAQDTVSYNWLNSAAVTFTAVMDSFAVGAQISYDNGINWITVSGTPTRAFYAQYGTIATGEDGLALPQVIAVEASPGADVAELRLRCYPGLWENTGTAFILDRTLCACASNALVRFIIKSTDGNGQFATWIGYWRHPTASDLN